MKSTRLRTRAIARCSTAPADALQTAAVTAAGAADRAEILRVLDLVEGYDQRRGVGQQLLGADVPVRRDLRAHPLMSRSAAQLFDLSGRGHRKLEWGGAQRASLASCRLRQP